MTGNKVICQHRRPRKELAFPTNGGCPVDWDKLKPRRFTHAILNDSGEIREHEDAWYGKEGDDKTWAMGAPFN
eukprot:7126979-Pyramimonas_sp.AAC.1